VPLGIDARGEKSVSSKNKKRKFQKDNRNLRKILSDI
jgi:hypothetical protein